MKLNFNSDKSAMVTLGEFHQAVGSRGALFRENYGGQRAPEVPPQDHWWWSRTFIFDGYVYMLVDCKKDAQHPAYSKRMDARCDPDYILCINLSSHSLRAIHEDVQVEPVAASVEIDHAITVRYSGTDHDDRTNGRRTAQPWR